MLVYSTNDSLNVTLNAKETRCLFGKFDSMPDKQTVKKNLFYIYKKASIKANSFPTGKISEIKFRRSRKTGCHIIYKKSVRTVNNRKKAGYAFLYSTDNSKNLFEIIENMYPNQKGKFYLYSNDKKFFLYSETDPEQDSFLSVNTYVKAVLDEYAKLLSTDAVKEIGRMLKNS